MSYQAKIIADSISPTGVRITTAELTFPRFILPEFNTHRVFSRNSASSRAIPVTKQIKKILETPFVPSRFGVNQSGMQAGKYLEGVAKQEAIDEWLDTMYQAVWGTLGLIIGRRVLLEAFGVNYRFSNVLQTQEGREKVYALLAQYDKETKEARVSGAVNHDYLDVHKQTANRPLEPYMWHTVLVTSTEYSNFIALRNSTEAQPEIEQITKLFIAAFDESTPTLLNYGEWHQPLIFDSEKEEARNDPEKWLKISAGRCARVSAETHFGTRDINADIRLFTDLKENGHMSPLEHQATPLKPIDGEEQWSGNFRGFLQWRKTFKHESDYSLILAEKASS